MKLGSVKPQRDFFKSFFFKMKNKKVSRKKESPQKTDLERKIGNLRYHLAKLEGENKILKKIVEEKCEISFVPRLKF